MEDLLKHRLPCCMVLSDSVDLWSGPMVPVPQDLEELRRELRPWGREI